MIARSRKKLMRKFARLALAMFVVIGSVTQGTTLLYAVGPVPIISYQGRVLNANGVPVADATASMKFEFYNDATAGDCVWSNSSIDCNGNTPASTTARTVTLTDGLFTENLGDSSASPAYADIASSIFGTHAKVFLQVYVNGEALLPRKQIVSAPLALNSDLVDGLDTTTTGSTTSAIVAFDSSGNLRVTGSPSGTGVGNGSIYVNPATAAANYTLFGVAVGGSQKFTVDAEGDGTLAGMLRVTSGVIDSPSPITIASSGGDIALSPSGTGLVYVTASDDFAVGSSTLVAPFSVDESLNTVRIGDGQNDVNDPTIIMYASDAADSGSFSFADDDKFSFANANFSHVGNGILPTSSGSTSVDHDVSSSYSGTSLATLNQIGLITLSGTNNYSAIENGASTDHQAVGARGLLSISGDTSTLTNGYGAFGHVLNSSTNVTLLQPGGILAGVYGDFTHAAAITLSDAHGVVGSVGVKAGTVTNAIGVAGRVVTAAGTVTNSYGGYFSSLATGSTRYGIYATANGGGTNYAGYFASGRVQIDDDSTPNTPSAAVGGGDLYVVNNIEADGGVMFGDSANNDTFSFTSNVSGSTAMTLQTDGLTTGTAFNIQRAGGGADFDGRLLSLIQGNSSATSDAVGLYIQNAGGGTSSVGLYISQSTTSPHVANSVGNNALLIDVLEAASTDNAIVMRSNVTGVADTEFRVTTEGNAYVDGAFTGGGADFAEYFQTSDTTLSGRHVVCQGTTTRTVKMCEAGNRNAMGVVSTNPAFIGNNIGDGTEDYSNDPRYRLVGLVGQVDTYVNAAEGAIAVGDPITTSSVIAGYGAKAQGPSRIIGFALDSLASGTGVVRVLVQPQWYGGDVLAHDGSALTVSDGVVMASLGAADAATSFDSHDLVLRGSGWNGIAVENKDIAIRTTVTDASEDYRLSVVNDDGVEVAYVSGEGDLALAGRLYPSDRGSLQTSKYIYYDGSSGAGGDFMRTNAAGWGTGSYDFAEMFPSKDALAAGEVVVFADSKEEVRRSTGTQYDDKIAGVVSTRPGFLAGDNLPGHVPVALAGRVPTYVSGENGAIAIGDPLTTSSKAGYAMKATEAGPIVGYAMESFSGNTGVVIAFIRPSYYDGGPVTDSPASENTVTQLATITSLNVSSINMMGGTILSIGSMSGIGNAWRLEEDGDFVTRGRIINLVRSFMNEDVETTPVLSRETTIHLSGTARLQSGVAQVRFDEVDAKFNDIISNEVPYRVLVTPAGATNSLYIAQRDQEGFTIRESQSQSSGVEVDWLVIAYHKDFVPSAAVPVVDAPEAEPVVSAPVTEEQGTTDPVEPAVGEITDPVVDAVEVIEEESDTTVVAPVDSGDATIPVEPEGEVTVTPEEASAPTEGSGVDAASSSDAVVE